MHDTHRILLLTESLPIKKKCEERKTEKKMLEKQFG